MASKGRGNFKRLCKDRASLFSDKNRHSTNTEATDNHAIGTGHISQPSTGNASKGVDSQNNSAIGNMFKTTTTHLTGSISISAGPKSVARQTVNCSGSQEPSANQQISKNQQPSIEIANVQPTQASTGHATSQPASSHPSPMEEESDVSAVSKKRKGRGPGKGIQLDLTVLRAGKVKLVFDKGLGRPNSAEDNRFLIGECGKIARTHTPFRLRSFTQIKPEDYETLIVRLRMKFDWDQNCPIGETCIYQCFARAYNNWKSTLGVKICSHSDLEDALQDREAGIDEPDWKWWVEHVRSPEYQGISKRNSQNRAKQAYNHRAGSKPFVFHEAALSQAAGSPIGFLELFKRTHYSENKGWVNDIAENQYNEMKNLIEESQSSPNGPITEDEARKLVLGTKSGYVRGYGRSRLPPQSPSLVSAQASMIKSLEGEVGDMRVKIKDQDEKMAKMFQMIELLQRDRNIESPGARCSRDGSHSPNEVDDINYY